MSGVFQPTKQPVMYTNATSTSLYTAAEKDGASNLWEPTPVSSDQLPCLQLMG